MYVHPDIAASPFVALLMYHQLFLYIIAYYNTKNPL